MRVRKDHVKEVIEAHISFETLYGKTNLKHVHVALLYRRGKLLGVATNFIGSRNKGCGYDHRTIHAERAVIKKVGDTAKLLGAILIVIRIAKGTREIVNSEPCHSCRCHLEKCIKEYGLRSIYYSV
jgi:Cytidine and deoxycytidylate deaminase zinc-binding region